MFMCVIGFWLSDWNFANKKVTIILACKSFGTNVQCESLVLTISLNLMSFPLWQKENFTAAVLFGIHQRPILTTYCFRTDILQNFSQENKFYAFTANESLPDFLIKLCSMSICSKMSWNFFSIKTVDRRINNLFGC